MLAEHQVDAVHRALELLKTRGGLLLADEVGLGKSFVAAEVLRTWLGGGSERLLELIVPAALVPQWRETLARFGADARVLTHEGICTDPYLPMPRRHLVVVDEAHAFRNPRTRRYAALARRCADAHVLLVTATPVCNSAGDLEALLSLLARDDLLAGVGVPSIDVAFAGRDAALIERIVGALVIRRDRTVLPAALQFGALERIVVRHPVPELPLLDELRFPLVGQPRLLRGFLRRRLESSGAAFLESVRRQLRFYDRALDAIASGHTLPKRQYRQAFAHEEDRDAFQEILFWELFAPAADVDPLEIRAEVARLESLAEAVRASPCRKRALLLALLGDEPALVFTGSAATAADLRDAIGGRCGLVTSRTRSRDTVLHAFVHGRLDVVVSTDMVAEGLNLQRAGVVVHYDIPWNPVKLDQRNGRAHRIGQDRQSVRAIYFLPESRETGIVATVARKNRMRRRLLQLGPQEQQASPRTLRPRVTSQAACVRLAKRVAALPEILQRRHKAGIERIIEEMSREYLDQRRIDDLVALVAGEV